MKLIKLWSISLLLSALVLAGCGQVSKETSGNPISNIPSISGITNNQTYNSPITIILNNGTGATCSATIDNLAYSFGTAYSTEGSHFLVVRLEYNSTINITTYNFTIDTTGPASPTSFSAQKGDGQVNLSWTNPGADFASVLIRRSSTDFPGTTSEGNEIYSGTNQTYADNGLSNGTKYYYSIWAKDSIGNFSTVSTASATPSTGPSFTSIIPSTNAWIDSIDMTLNDNNLYIAYGVGPNGGDSKLITYDGSNVNESSFSSGPVYTVKVYATANVVYVSNTNHGPWPGYQIVQKYESGSWSDYCVTNLNEQDLYVNNGKVYYITSSEEVKVSENTWNTLGGTSFYGSNSGREVMDFVGSTPYVCHVPADGIYVTKYNGANWEQVGSKINDSDFNYTHEYHYKKFVINDGVPYVSYFNGTNIIVKKYNGASWEQIGSGIPYDPNADNTIGITFSYYDFAVHNEEVYVAYKYNNEIKLSHYTGGNWVTENDPSAMPFTTGKIHLEMNESGIYMLLYENNSYRAYKFE